MDSEIKKVEEPKAEYGELPVELQRGLRLTPAQRLAWLEQAKRFVEMVSQARKKK